MERVITDETGRSLTLRKVGVLERFRLYKVLGPEHAINQASMGLAVVAASVSAIDGVPFPFPVNEAGIEAVLSRIGEAGLSAIVASIQDAPFAEVMAEAGN